MDFPAWDPVLLEIPGLPIGVRWYGLMYVVGFVAGQVILSRLSQAQFLPIAREKVGDLILYLVFGVLLGGRLGYALFYDQGLTDPARLIRVWEGGLAFHGGLLGVAAAMALFCRRNKVHWSRVADSLAFSVCPGILAVRIANFINGELYGRETSADTPFAMQFPTDDRAAALLGIDGVGGLRIKELCIQVATGRRSWDSVAERLKEDAPKVPWDTVRERLEGADGRTGWDIVRELRGPDGDLLIPYRHPSQLYEGLTEGALVGILLWILYRRTRKRPLGPGSYAGIFLLGYAASRFACEFVRQPDRQFRNEDDPLGTVLLGMTMGQTLTLGMIVAGVGLLMYGSKRRDAGEKAS